MRRFVTLAALLLLASGARAQTPGSCALGTAQGDLDVSNVFARVFNTGSLFFGNTHHERRRLHRPPVLRHLSHLRRRAHARRDGERRGPRRGLPVHPTSPSGPARSTRTARCPTPTTARPSTASTSSAWPTSPRTRPRARRAPDLADWPVGLGAPAVDASGQPLAVSSREQTLDLAAGERPVHLREPDGVLGHERRRRPAHCAWTRSRSGSRSASPPSPSRRTTSSARQRPRSTATRSSTGARTSSRTFTRGSSPTPTSGTPPTTTSTRTPRAGWRGVQRAGDRRGVRHARPRSGSTSSPAPRRRAPSSAEGLRGLATPRRARTIYNFMHGLWGDGTVMRANGDGYNQPTTFPVTRYVFTGDPVTEAFWSEENNDGSGTNNASGDRRMLIASAAVSTLAPGATHTLDLGILFAQGADRLEQRHRAPRGERRGAGGLRRRHASSTRWPRQRRSPRRSLWRQRRACSL